MVTLSAAENYGTLPVMRHVLRSMAAEIGGTVGLLRQVATGLYQACIELLVMAR